MLNNTLSENKIIDELKILFESSKGRVGIGDDAAVIEHNQLISTDAIVEGIHFLRDKASWEDIAYKLFASNASDIASMGGFVTGYTLALSIPEYWHYKEFKSFTTGIREFLKEFPADLLGGDTVRSKTFFASVTVLGKTNAIPWLRTNAKEGDFIYCTGTLGDSRMFLNKELGTSSLPLTNLSYFKERHYRPKPRLDIVPFLKQCHVTSAMDISDGLIEDLNKLSQSSKLSYFIDADSLPISIEEIGEGNFAEHKIFYQKEALIGGEDYELIFTSPDLIDNGVLNNNPKITRIGRILSSKDKSFILYRGQRTFPDQFKGYEH